jgi:uncharacterized protein YbaP (TraB family)
MFFWRTKRKPFRMVWRIEKEGKTSYLGGTAHFFPSSLRRDIEKLIHWTEDVLFEGPLDQESMARVANYGRQGESGPSVYEALDPAAKKEINKQFSHPFSHPLSSDSYLQLFIPSSSDFLEAYTRGVRPWMAFFNLWSSNLNWRHSIDLEAYYIALKMGKKIHFLETIEEQLAALDGIPFERIVEYVNTFEHWKSYKEQFLRDFLEGNLEKLMSRTNKFPTRCESILGRRDERFFERMKPFVERGSAIAFFGLSHIPAIKKMFINEGYDVTQVLS